MPLISIFLTLGLCFYQVRASAVFALGTLIDVGSDSFRDTALGDEDCDDDDKNKAELDIVRSLMKIISDGSPLVRAEVAVGMHLFLLIYAANLWYFLLKINCTSISIADL